MALGKSSRLGLAVLVEFKVIKITLQVVRMLFRLNHGHVDCRGISQNYLKLYLKLIIYAYKTVE